LSKTALELIDALISGWNQWEANESYYLDELVPSIVRGDNSIRLMPRERELVAELHELLAADEWEQLPKWVQVRRAHGLVEIESDRKRQREEQAHRKKLEDERRARLEADRERQRQEELERQRQLEADRQRQLQEALERERREAEFESRQSAFRTRVLKTLYTSFLSADNLIMQDDDAELLDQNQYEQWKMRFVQKWAETKNIKLDMQQAKAVSTVGGDIQVVARAGAGKTRTLIARALFLQTHCNVSPHELLLLAFNRSAAKEIKNRLDQSLEGNTPHVMTFHALARALVQPQGAILYDNRSDETYALSSAIQAVVDHHLQSEEFRPLIRDLMLSHFRDDWERIVNGGFHLQIDELIKYRHALPRETLNGKYVKSFGEKLISNILFEHDIDFQYERNFLWNGMNYKPDFSIRLEEGRGVAIEYFGLKGDPDYDHEAERKRKFWKEYDGWTLLEFIPSDIARLGIEGFTEELLLRLEAVGVTGRPLSEEEIWERIQGRAIDKFTEAVGSFITRCRMRDMSIEGLQRLIEGHDALNTAERLFLTISASVYAGYVQRLKISNQQDFAGLVWAAVGLLKAGKSRFDRQQVKEHGDLSRIRYVLVDEFQDFSEMFYMLSDGIRRVSPGVEFFCVGDDWQAINGFAGSELRYFENFQTLFRAPRTLNVSTNYRSPAHVVKVGNALMSGRGTPATADQSEIGWIRLFYLSDFTTSSSEHERFNGDKSTPALLRIVRLMLDSGQDVVLLARIHGVPWFVSYARETHGRVDGLERFAEHIRSFLPKEDRRRVTASTAHGYKGLERSAVIVLDANVGRYPLIHPTWLFMRVFGDGLEKIEAEERRLFYVALTRAKQSLIILSAAPERASPYLTDILDKVDIKRLNQRDLPLFQPLDGARLEVQVFNAYEVRDQLKAIGYHWQDQAKCWRRSIMAEGFDFNTLLRQAWAKHSGIRIKVCSETGELIAQK
jgi:DNA helicase-4